MKKYLISLNWMMESEEFKGTLEEAKKYADERITCNEQDCKIYNAEGEIVAIRKWRGINFETSEDSSTNPITFGDFGYYEDWQENVDITIKDITESYNVSLIDISRRFKIPYRTIIHWAGGDRQAPQYIIDMIKEIYEFERQ